MAMSQRPSEGQTVFVAVDSRSLAAIGAWPWSRSVHAELLGRLVDGGAVDILLDFDFTFPLDAEGDQDLERALEQSGGSVYLAVFEQSADLSADSPRHTNLPLERFADRSWPALVNVGTDESGLVRDYPFGAQLADTYVPSAAALLANAFGGDDASFEINYSIAPASIPVISAIDLLNDAVPPDAVNGKTVIVGAAAIELSDQLAVPVHGVIPGPLIHALATETLARNLVPAWLRAEWVAILLFLCLLLVDAVARRRALLGLAGASFVLL